MTSPHDSDLGDPDLGDVDGDDLAAPRTLHVADRPGLLLRPLSTNDIPALAAIADEPEVRQWWRTEDADVLHERLGQTDEEDEVPFAIVLDGAVIGYVQYYEEADPEFVHAGMDIYLGAAAQGRGIGRAVLTRLCQHLFEDRGHHRLVIDPDVENHAAIRCYESIGFQRVGILRQYWTTPEGEKRDALLLDLLVDEFGR